MDRSAEAAHGELAADEASSVAVNELPWVCKREGTPETSSESPRS